MDVSDTTIFSLDPVNVMEAALDCIVVIDELGRIVEFNPAAETTFGVLRADVLGREMADLLIPEQYRESHREGLRHYIASGQGPIIGKRIEITALRADGAEFPVELTVAPLTLSNPRHFIGFIRDISERVEAEAALRQSEESLSDFFENATVGLHWVNAEGIIIRANEAELDLLGYSADEYIGHPITEFHADSEVIDDILRRLSSGEALHSYEARLRCKDGSTRWVLISSNVLWDNGRFVHTRCFTRDITERKQAEQALIESEARYEEYYRREALINEIGAAVRASLDPDEVQAAGSTVLGTTLAADRCLYVSYSHPTGTATVGPDWRTDDLPSIAGVYLLSDFAALIDALFTQGTSVISDLADSGLPPDAAEVLARAGCRSVLAVPFYNEHRLVGALFLMSKLPRAWRPGDITLVEQVATMTRTAVEAARASHREHAIATQLQEALQPALPGTIPGLDVADYYSAALGEAAVGGDFFDVFADDKGLTFFVVGDMSGKGLAAARQVATVRNMLRLALYSTNSPVPAVTLVNHTLATHRLISGFATLFVGCYDSGLRLFTYVNCGQEPALLRRAAGEIEELSPTGPILGAVADMSYDGRTVRLLSGDAFAIFTDGLTEVGPNRADMLGVPGVKALFSSLPAHAAARDLARGLIEGIAQYAPDGIRDDQCLLLAVVNGGQAEAIQPPGVTSN